MAQVRNVNESSNAHSHLFRSIFSSNVCIKKSEITGKDAFEQIEDVVQDFRYEQNFGEASDNYILHGRDQLAKTRSENKISWENYETNTFTEIIK